MKQKFSLLLSSLIYLTVGGQDLPAQFTITKINKAVKEFPPTFDLSSPLRSFLSYTQFILIDGKNSLQRVASTDINRFSLPDSTAPDTKIPEAVKNKYLNTIVKEIITYKDSVAFVLSYFKETFYYIRCFYREYSKWVNVGEDGRTDLQQARNYVIQLAVEDIKRLRKYYRFSIVPKDTLSFSQYLNDKSEDPKKFMLQKLKNYQLVIYGEIHRRKLSWDFLREVSLEKQFPRTTGVIFLELPSHKQHDMNHFMIKDTIDRELLLNIFREADIDGWQDKGMFDFIISIWKLNRKLPLDHRIRVILADAPRPYSTFLSKEDFRNSDLAFNRDTVMANSVINYLETAKDERNALFIVGAAHVAKSLPSAGSVLSSIMGRKCYTIFTHCPEMDNWAHVTKRIRHGMFDYAFYKAGDHPLAFQLRDSPYGNEPFDGLYFDGSDNFQDNYDGYIFLGPLDKEPNAEILFDLYDDVFINELNRRYKLIGLDLKEDWHLKNLDTKEVRNALLSEHTSTRFSYLKPLKNGKLDQF